MFSVVSKAQHFDHIEFERPNVTSAQNTNLAVNVYDVIQDKQGYIWAATSKGLHRYDGRNVFKISHNIKDSTFLENTLCRVLLQDNKGGIWIGTQGEGLCRYDYIENSVECFQHIKGDSTSIDNNDIWSIYQDSKQRLWVGSSKGLNQFDYETNSFRSYKSSSIGGAGIDGLVICVQEDAQQNIWISHWKKGLKMLLPSDTDEPSFLSISYDTLAVNGLKSNHISDIVIDKRGQMWLAAFEGGISLMLPPDSSIATKNYKQTDFQFLNLKNTFNEPDILPDNIAFSIEKDMEGFLWIGTPSGLAVINPKVIDMRTEASIKQSFQQLQVQQFKSSSNNPTSAISRIKKIYTDSHGIIWYATMDGLFKYVPSLKRFDNRVVLNDALPSANISAFFKNEEGELYVGASTRGIFKYDAVNNRHIPLNIIANPRVLELYEDKDKTLWIGTREGFYSYHARGGIKKYPLHFPKDPNKKSNHIRRIFIDSDGRMWLATQSGLVLFDSDKEKHIYFEPDEEIKGSISHNSIIDIAEDANRNLYIATQGGGLSILSLDSIGKQQFKLLKDIAKVQKKVWKSDILTAVDVHENNLWIGSERGILRFDIANQTLHDCSILNEQIAVQIQGLECDANGVVWISTHTGLYSYDNEKKQLRSFKLDDGIPVGLDFTASYKDKDNNIYFGGLNSYVTFDAKQIRENVFEADDKVLITGLTIAGQAIQIDEKDSYTGRAILTKNISQTNQITLSTNHHNINLEFTILDHAYAARHTYAYRMSGLEDDWNITTNQVPKSYSALPEGDYVFEVKAQNSDGYESAITELHIHVDAPFWKTTWFRILAVLALALGVYLFIRYRTHLAKQEHTKLELLVSQRTRELEHKNVEKEFARLASDASRQLAEKAKKEAEESRNLAEKANKAKTTFLATMSHEIRTPMNAILGMLELLSSTILTNEQRDYVQIMQSSGTSLMAIINDILDFTKIESGKMEIDNTSFHLEDFLNEVIISFSVPAARKGLMILLEIEEGLPTHIVSDSVRLRQILVNLLNNAIKFTEKGSVKLSVSRDKTATNGDYKLFFQVIDTGIGIPQDKKDMLFNAFIQGDATTTRKYGGTGLGLAISMRLVQLLGGKITLDSKEGEGATFAFTIVTQIDEVKNQKDEADKLVNGANQTRLTGTEELPSRLVRPEGIKLADSAPLEILIVEDNKFNQILLQKVLQKMGYIPSLVDNGAKAVKIVQEQTFDLIFMDLNMPEMDGIAATKIIRQELVLDKQPAIVALTANAQAETKDLCLSIGMQCFITKPFKSEDIKGIIQSMADN